MSTNPNAEHRCANCFVAQYGMKSNVRCKNEWWSEWDYRYGKAAA